MLASEFTIPDIIGMGLEFRIDGFRLVYLLVTIVMWLCSTLISPAYFGKSKDKGRYYVFSILTFLATVGVFLSGNLYTTFCFFEIMSFTSYVLVAHTEKDNTLRAAITYLAVAVIGGLVMLMGLFMLYNITGTLSISELSSITGPILTGDDAALRTELFVAGFLILFGFGAKAGMFPLHIWLPKAHPVAPAPASALLSGILTKCGVFGVLILCLEIFVDSTVFGSVIYILGFITMLTGAFLALFSTDLKRTLACSSVSQIGFILVGIGLVPMLGAEECTLAATGSFLYMINHSMFKLCLFLAAGAIYMKAHSLDLNELKGFGRNKPLLKVLFLIGALGISGVPLFSGYVSKTLIHEGIVEFIGVAADFTGLIRISEWVFLLSGGMTFAYMTKLFVAIFIEKPEKEESNKTSYSVASMIAIIIPAAFILVCGVLPNMFINKIGTFMTGFNNFSLNEEQLATLSNINIFSLENLKGAAISIAIGLLLYFVVIRKFLVVRDSKGNTEYVDKWPVWLDIEEVIYRPLLVKILPAILGGICKFFGNLFENILRLLRKTCFRDLHKREHNLLCKISHKIHENQNSDDEISSTISYGLLMICFGLCLTIFYLFYLLFS